jgi:hypothetical protein
MPKVLRKVLRNCYENCYETWYESLACWLQEPQKPGENRAFENAIPFESLTQVNEAGAGACQSADWGGTAA